MATQSEWEAAFQKTLGAVVRQVRLERGLNQEQLAEAAQLHQNTVRLLEQGKRMPSILLLIQVAAGLRVSVADLLRRVEAEVGLGPWAAASSRDQD